MACTVLRPAWREDAARCEVVEAQLSARSVFNRGTGAGDQSDRWNRIMAFKDECTRADLATLEWVFTVATRYIEMLPETELTEKRTFVLDQLESLEQRVRLTLLKVVSI